MVLEDLRQALGLLGDFGIDRLHRMKQAELLVLLLLVVVLLLVVLLLLTIIIVLSFIAIIIIGQSARTCARATTDEVPYHIRPSYTRADVRGCQLAG